MCSMRTERLSIAVSSCSWPTSVVGPCAGDISTLQALMCSMRIERLSIAISSCSWPTAVVGPCAGDISLFCPPCKSICMGLTAKIGINSRVQTMQKRVIRGRSQGSSTGPPGIGQQDIEVRHRAQRCFVATHNYIAVCLKFDTKP